MQQPKQITWDPDQQSGQPPGVRDLIGMHVERAWSVPSLSLVMVLLREKYFLMVRAIEVNGRAALQVEVGPERPGAIWTDLDEDIPRTTRVEALRGRPFTGIHDDVLAFGAVGARINSTGIQWVRKAN